MGLLPLPNSTNFYHNTAPMGFKILIKKHKEAKGSESRHFGN
jgi:hypothetical protein